MSISLYKYIMNNFGLTDKIVGTEVWSVKGNLGIVDEIDFVYFRDGSSDIERTWVKITWVTGEETVTTADFLDKVPVKNKM